MKSLWEGFCKNSSLHGVQYVVDTSHKSPLSRLLWSCLLGLITVVLVVNTYYLWLAVHLGPVQVLVDNPTFSLKYVEFPEVIVCPKTKILKRKVATVVKNYKFDEQTSSAFERSLLALSLMRFPYYNLPQDYLDLKNESVYKIPNRDIEGLMREVSADVDDIMVGCSWKGDEIDCKELFRKKVTGEGFCFVFNNKRTFVWKDGRKQLVYYEPSGKTIETRNDLYGSSSGLGFTLKALAHEQLTGDVEGDSYNVIATNPYTSPDLSYATTVLPDTPWKQVLIGVSVFVIEADTSLNNLEESERECYFQKFENMSEVKMCDCALKMIFQMCQCIPFYLYHPESRTICGLEHLRCLRKINPFLRNYGIHESTPGFPSWTQPITHDCFCSHPCSQTIYSQEMRVIRLPSRNPDNGTGVEVFYEDFAVKYSRTVPYEVRDFVVELGSIAGLFMGFSLVAVCDFVMYVFKCLIQYLKRTCIKENSQQLAFENRKNCAKVMMGGTVLFQRRSYLSNQQARTDLNTRLLLHKPSRTHQPNIFVLHGPAEPYFPFVN